MSDANRDFVALAVAAQLPLAAWGVELVAVSQGSVTLSCPISEAMTTAGTGIVMGGIVATLADVAAGLSIISGMDQPGPVTTLCFTSSQTGPAKGERLEIVGHLERLGRTVAFSGAEVFAISQSGRRKCAILTATFAVST